MCGIAGIITKNKKIDIDLINQIKNSIKHRGPDADGIFILENIALIHTRLSILDIKGGVQPMHSFDKRFVIIFNGEIYNYKEIKEVLIKKGHVFYSNSDTEVVLNSFIEWGNECMDYFNGEWAFSIWDNKEKLLFLSRDRYGIKPLYYYESGDYFSFSSELKTFYKTTNISFDYNEIWDLMVFGPKPGGKTFLQGVKELLPGEYLFYRDYSIKTNKYYKLENTLLEERISFDLNKIEELLIDSIKKRMIADVKVSTINSGGLDSSFVSKIANDNYAGKLNTFSVAPEKINGKILPGDESEFASFLSQNINSEHYTVRYSQKEFIEAIPDLVYQNDGFLFHSNSIPLSKMFKFISDKGIKVALGGEGADEVFRGYSLNKLAKLYSLFNFKEHDNFILTVLKQKYPEVFRVGNFFDGLNFYAMLSIKRNMQMTPTLASKILGIDKYISDDRLEVMEIMKTLPPKNQMIYYEQKCYLTGLLQRVDRMSMKWGLEARVPFLDHRLVNYLNSIDFDLKTGIREKKVKILLKKIAQKHIHNKIINRKKYGFSSAINSLERELKEVLMGDNTIPEISKTQDLFLLYNYNIIKNFI